MKGKQVVYRIRTAGKRKTPFSKRLTNTCYRRIWFFGTDKQYKKLNHEQEKV